MEQCLKYTKKELIQQVHDKNPYLKGLSIYNKNELCTLLTKPCANMGGLVNENNSCYFDSFLVAMLHDSDDFIKIIKTAPYAESNNTLNAVAEEIRATLIQISNSIEKGSITKCTNLRLLATKYDSLYCDIFKIKRASKITYPFDMLDWKHSQLEPSDVVKLLNRVFRIPNDVNFHQTLYGSNKKRKVLRKIDMELVVTENKITNFAGIYIDAEHLFMSSQLLLKKFIPKHKNEVIFDDSSNYWKPQNGKSYRRKIEVITYKSAPRLFIHIARLFAGEKLTTEVVAPIKVKLRDNKRNLYLKSIIVHHGHAEGGHYTAMLECGGEWYHYNDIAYTKLKKIGSYDDLLKYKDGYVFKNCTNIMYA